MEENEESEKSEEPIDELKNVTEIYLLKKV